MEWIAVADKLPPRREKVIGIRAGEAHSIDFMSFHGNGYWALSGTNGPMHHPPTHWQPIKPPRVLFLCWNASYPPSNYTPARIPATTEEEAVREFARTDRLLPDRVLVVQEGHDTGRWYSLKPKLDITREEKQVIREEDIL